MPILDLQMKLRQLGRIRAGEVVETQAGKRRPSKLEHFKITSHSEQIIREVADLYGGTPSRWTPNNGGDADEQWAVTVTVDRIPVMLPPQSISQHYELWSGGGATRRCDGETEKLSGQRCLCDPDPKKRECAVTTRLNVILRDVRGLGVFRLDSKGYYAAVELPQVAAFLEHAGSYIEAHLALEPRSDKKDGKTRHWLTPVLDVDISPAQLLAGNAATTALHATPGTAGAISGTVAQPELPGAPTGPVMVDVDSLRRRVDDCDTPDQLRALWGEVSGRDKLLQDPANAKAAALFTERAAKIKPPDEKPAGDTGSAAAPAAAAPPEITVDPEIEDLWAQVQRAAPSGWTSGQLDDDFANIIGVDPGDATASHMRTYLELSRGPETTP